MQSISLIINTSDERLVIPPFGGNNLTHDDIVNGLSVYEKQHPKLKTRSERVCIYRQQHLTRLLPLIHYFTEPGSNLYPTFIKDGKCYSLIIGRYNNWKMRVVFDAPGLPSIDLLRIEKAPIEGMFIGMGSFSNRRYGGLDWDIQKA